MPRYRLAIASDHAGVALKKRLLAELEELGHTTRDLGPDNETSVDYPDFAHPLCQLVETGDADLGILICGSGTGMTITANKHAKIRAANCWNPEIARLARAHNDANVLCLPARFISTEEAIAILKTFLSTPFEGGRHEQRVAKIGTC
ncbi:MAG: ribose 5-phosphate isomerase B [Armatimonas sp.]